MFSQLLVFVSQFVRFRWFFPGEPPYNLDTHPRLEYAAPRAFFANQRADLVWRLDERRVPLEQSYLHLADYLRKKTLSSDRYNNLIRVIAARASEADGSLLRSIAWGIVDARDDTPERRALAEQVLDPRTLRTMFDKLVSRHLAYCTRLIDARQDGGGERAGEAEQMSVVFPERLHDAVFRLHHQSPRPLRDPT